MKSQRVRKSTLFWTSAGARLCVGGFCRHCLI
jgi:hypothetical protein